MPIETLDVEELAKIIKETKITVYRQVASEVLPPPIRIGRKMFWLKTTIENFLNEKSQVVKIPKHESPSKLKARHNAAMQKLSKDHGITVKPQPHKQ